MNPDRKNRIFHSKMSLNWAMKAITYLLVCGVGIVLPAIIGILYAKIFDNQAFLLFPIPFVSIFFSVWLFSPKAVSLSKEFLEIERPIGPLKIELAQIKSIEKIIDLQKFAGFYLRLWGSGGAWGSFGLFWSKKIGIFRLYLTNNNFVFLEMKNGKKLFLSPDKRDSFIKELQNITKLSNK